MLLKAFLEKTYRYSNFSMSRTDFVFSQILPKLAFCMEDGEYTTLNNCASIRIGYTFKGPPKNEAAGNLSVILPRDISEGKVTGIPVKVLSEEMSLLQNHILNEGEILIANKGIKLGTFLYEGTPSIAVATSAFFIIKPNEQIMPKYLNWYLNQPQSREYFAQRAIGSTVPSITKSILSELQIPLVSIEKQRHIIEFLEACEKELSLLIDLIAKKREFGNSYIWEHIKKHI